MRVIRGPWRWVTDAGESFWAPPDGYSGLDLRSVEQQSTAGGTPGLGIFCGTGNTDGSYDLLGTGALRDIKASKKIRDAIPGKYRPKGDDLLGILLDLLTDGSDPGGIEGPKPIMPTTRGTIELHFGGQSHFERFQWGDHRTAKIRDVVHRDFARVMQESLDGKMKDRIHHQRILDAICEKYGVNDWKQFVPSILQKDVPGRVKHETTYTDNFNRADATGLGAAWSTTAGAGFDVSSNRARGANAASTATRARFDSDLSSSDHYAQVEIVSFPPTSGFTSGSNVRQSSVADTCYRFVGRDDVSPRRLVAKVVAGTNTTLVSDGTVAATGVWRLECNGSSLSAYIGGVEISGLGLTDTSISAGTRGGMSGIQNATVASRSLMDNFETGDLAASGVLYTQLESGVRGVTRGVYTRNGG
jgi:hypothetical protein